ncbi:YhcN/YlaJ family sporulation lipoprotein [Neobacillus drentensis]|uniref:YhcN/YlaJ family sporulation lipoprotein n=1 Tax=Neobacillus drentensis TaxID=220684 RepID=UPI001F192ED8|nr:YhcN/YlaJ family sporulation lipoprotein [Neobacillus drentensis]ULT55266.1 YhcN/YlaJ family sporulation lipoprotein [Neobacillus drentensis]
MKKRLFVTITLIFSLYIAGCSKNNVDDDLTKQKLDPRKTESAKVNYNTPAHGGPAITSVDTSDPEIDRQRNHNKHSTNTQIQYDTSKIIVANRAADRVTDLSRIERANIIVTDNNAYVAVKMADSTYNQLTATTRSKITRAVKSVDGNIDNVYISENRQFYKRMSSYTRDIRSGRTNSDFIDRFSDTIRRVFPDAR